MTNKLAKEASEIPALFVEYWNQRNAAGIASLFKENAEFVNVVGLWWHNKKAIEKAHKYGLETIFKDSTLKLTRVKLRELSKEITVVHAKMNISGQTARDDIHSPMDRNNIFTFVCSKTEGFWLCEAAHNTDVVPGKETNIVNARGELMAIDYRKKAISSECKSI